MKYKFHFLKNMFFITGRIDIVEEQSMRLIDYFSTLLVQIELV